jgi:hypothetical protein
LEALRSSESTNTPFAGGSVALSASALGRLKRDANGRGAERGDKDDGESNSAIHHDSR